MLTKNQKLFISSNLCSNNFISVTLSPTRMIPILFIFVFITRVFGTDECILDIQPSSSCESPYWNGFLDKECCESPFEEYLSALAKHANQTGSIFLNPIQQQSCRSSLEGSNGRNLLSCGVEKLTAHSGSCSGFTVTDVANKLESSLASLDQDCELLESRNDCGSCLNRWLSIRALNMNTSVEEIEICRFTVLVSMVSRKISDTEWAQAVYQCLGKNQSQNLAHEDDYQKHKKNLSIGELT